MINIYSYIISKTNSLLFNLFLSRYIFFFQLPFLPEMMLSSYDYKNIEMMYGQIPKGGKKATCDPDEIEAYKFSLSRPGQSIYYI